MNKNIKITPAILESDLNEFRRQLDIYSKLFDRIDIDVNIKNDNFPGKVTLGTAEVIDLIRGHDKEFGIHLMAENPEREIREFEKAALNKNFKFYVHQQSVFKHSENICAVISPGDKIKNLDFYNQFEEIQLMTVNPGEQGGEFLRYVLANVIFLRTIGYKGFISIDGGVNLRTAEIIKNYDIDRVSVGSYFSKCENVEAAKKELEAVLSERGKVPGC